MEENNLEINNINNDNNNNNKDNTKNEPKKNKNYKMKDFTYYSYIVMMIVISIQLILFIIFIVFAHTVGDEMNDVNKNAYSTLKIDFDFVFDEQKQGVDTCFAFFIIAFVIYLIEFVFHFACDGCDYRYNTIRTFLSDLNHFIIILTFLVSQFLYLICCLIFPIYLERVRTLRDYLEPHINLKKDLDNLGIDLDSLKISVLTKDDLDKMDSCVAKYAGAVVFAFVFLVIFIFLYFIILNLYKGTCCDMFTICRKTNDCFDKFGGCMRDNVYCIFNCGKGQDPEIEKLKRIIAERKKTIERITCNIQNGLKNNIKLRVDNIEYL